MAGDLQSGHTVNVLVSGMTAGLSTKPEVWV